MSEFHAAASGREAFQRVHGVPPGGRGAAFRGRSGRRHRLMGFALAVAAAMAWGSPAAFGEPVYTDLVVEAQFNRPFDELDCEWSKFLGFEFGQRNMSAGGIVGSANAVIFPETPLTPAVRADTRTGLKLTGTASGKAGLALDARFDAGGVAYDGDVTVRPQVAPPENISPYALFSLSGATTFKTVASDLVVTKPTFTAEADLVLNAALKGTLQAHLPGVLHESWNLGIPSINVNTDLFQVELDLANLTLPKPTFFGLTLPGAVEDADAWTYDLCGKGTAKFFKPSGWSVDAPAINGAGHLVSKTSGGLVSLQLNLPGLANVDTSWEHLTGWYDASATLVDVQYGPELGFEYEGGLVPVAFATVAFDKPVRVKQADGTTQVVTSIGETALDDLPDIALLEIDGPTTATVSLTDLELHYYHSGRLVVTDRLDFEALSASASMAGAAAELGGKSVGPVIDKTFRPIASLFDFAPWTFSLFENEEILLGDGAVFTMDVSGRSFTVPLAPGDPQHVCAIPAFVEDGKGMLRSLEKPASYRRVDAPSSAPTAAQLEAATVIIGTPVTEQERADGGLSFPSTLLGQLKAECVDKGSLDTTPPWGYQVLDPVRVASLVVPAGTDYRVSGDREWWEGYSGNPEPVARRFRVSQVQCDGRIVNDGYLEFDGEGYLSLVGQGTMEFNGPCLLKAYDPGVAPEDGRLLIGDGLTLRFVNEYRPGFSVSQRDGPREEFSDHLLQAGRLENAGLIEVFVPVGSFEIQATHGLQNTGTIAVLGCNRDDDLPAGILLPMPELVNSGEIRAANGSWIVIGSVLGPPVRVGTKTLPSGQEAPGLFRVESESLLEFCAPVTLAGPQRFEVDGGGALCFKKDVTVEAPGEIHIGPLSTMEMSGVTIAGTGPRFTIHNEGLFHVLYDDFRDCTLGESVCLTNEGTVQVDRWATLSFVDRSPDPTVLEGGTWVVEGEIEQNFLAESAQPGPDVGLTNLADVTLKNAGQWYPLRYLSENHGRLCLQAEADSQALTVADHPLLNTGTILVAGHPYDPDLRSHLDLAKGLTIADGGLVELQGYAILEVGFEYNGRQHDNTIEVVGGTLRAGPWATIAGLSGTTLEGGELVWTVRDAVDEATGAVTPGIIDLYGHSIMYNKGHVTLAGSQARFDAMQALRGNLYTDTGCGRLDIQDGFHLSLDHDFTNEYLVHVVRGGRLSVAGTLWATDTLWGTEHGYITVGDAFLDAGSLELVGGGLHVSSTEPGVPADPALTCGPCTIRWGGWLSVTGAAADLGHLDAAYGDVWLATADLHCTSARIGGGGKAEVRAGQDVLWTVDGRLDVDNGGVVTVSDGGEVYASQTGAGGTWINPGGKITVTGTDSALRSGHMAVKGGSFEVLKGGLAVCDNLRIDQDATVVVRNNWARLESFETEVGTVGAGELRLGYDALALCGPLTAGAGPGAKGTVKVEYSADMFVEGPLFVGGPGEPGRLAEGRLEIRASDSEHPGESRVTAFEVHIGGMPYSKGSALVSFPPASLTSYGELVVGAGEGADGLLHVGNGASVQVPEARIGSGPGSTGQITLWGYWDGTSTFSCDGLLTLGDEGTGTLEILNYSSAETALAVIGGSPSFEPGTGTGTVIVEGDHARWTNFTFVGVGLATGSAGRIEARGGGRINIGDSLAVGEGSTVELADGKMAIGSLTADPARGQLQVGLSPSSGSLEVNGGQVHCASAAIDGTFVLQSGTGWGLDVDGLLEVGSESTGSESTGLRVEDGGRVRAGQCHVVKGWLIAETPAHLEAGVYLEAGSELTVGSLAGAQAGLDIGLNSEVAAPVCYVGKVHGSEGIVTVAPESRLSLADPHLMIDPGLYIGGSEDEAGGYGLVSVEGAVEIDGLVRLWDGGRLELQGGHLTCTSFDNAAGGTFEMTGGELHVETFLGDLVSDGGMLCPGSSPGLMAVEGNLTVNAGCLQIEMNGLDQGDLADGNGIGYDFFSVAGAATLNGFMELVLLDGYQPHEGDVFDVLTADSVVLDPAFSLDWTKADLGPVLSWDYDVAGGNSQTLRLKVVPEPATLALLAAGGLGLLARRSRRRSA